MGKKKFHIDTNGYPQVCSANIRACPRGGEDYHTDTKEQAFALADRINEEISEARQSIGNKVNKVTSIFDGKHPLTKKIKSRKALIDKHETELWKQKYREYMLEEPFSGYTEQSFRKEYLEKDPDYLAVKRDYNSLIEDRGLYIQQRKKTIEIAKQLRPYLRTISFSNASGSSYLVFGKKDSEIVLKKLKENDIIIDRADIEHSKNNSVFAVRLSDHKKHRTRYNKTTTEVSGRFGKLDKIKPKDHKKELKDLELGGERYIAQLMREINGRR